MPPLDHSTVHTCTTAFWHSRSGELLERCGLAECLDGRPVLIKPNLVEVLPPPITTPMEFVEKLVIFLLDHLPPSRISIGEGCGAMEHDTFHAFSELGYTDMVKRYNIELIDLNEEKPVRRSNPQCRRWPEMYLPGLLDEVFLLSVPQLKAHSLSGVTLTMKNMMGCAPPSRYGGGGAWKKAAFHEAIQEAVFDLNRYRTPDFTLLDASVGMAKAHLWGPQCDPPVDRIVASADPVAVDSYGTALLGKRWQDIGHIAMADGVLGKARDFFLEEIA